MNGTSSGGTVCIAALLRTLSRRDDFEIEVDVVERLDQVAAAADRLLTRHVARFDRADMVYHPKTFANLRERGFLLECRGRMAKRGELRIFGSKNAEVVASRTRPHMHSKLMPRCRHRPKTGSLSPWISA